MMPRKAHRPCSQAQGFEHIGGYGAVTRRRQIAVADIGGTHARFALATLEGTRVLSLDRTLKMRAADHRSLHSAWQHYARECGPDLPREGAFAIAAPVGGDVLRFTNSSWTLRPGLISSDFALDRFTLVNDFGAVCHSIDGMGAGELAHICGPDTGLPDHGAISVIGPGTGLGVAYLARGARGSQVFETEGGHIAFAPLDEVEDRILARLRNQHRRVSLERVIAGNGLQTIYAVLCEIEHAEPRQLDDRDLWALALEGGDKIVEAAFDRYCRCLGSAAGDFVLAHGAKAIVIAGGLGHRIGDRLANSRFRERFTLKGRFSHLLEATPVYRSLEEEPGLLGAAIAFAKEYPA